MGVSLRYLNLYTQVVYRNCFLLPHGSFFADLRHMDPRQKVSNLSTPSWEFPRRALVLGAISKEESFYSLMGVSSAR